MKVADLVLRLQQLRPDAEVMAFDADAGVVMPITGYLYSPGEDPPSVELCTDDMNAAVELGPVHHFGKPETQQLHAFLRQSSKPCNYPHCGCPFDHPGTEGWCAQGRPTA